MCEQLTPQSQDFNKIIDIIENARTRAIKMQKTLIRILGIYFL